MSGRARKRKSMWDSKEEPQLPDPISEKNAWHEKENYSNLHVSHDPKLSDLEDVNALKSKRFSGRPSWEPSDGNSRKKDDRRDSNGAHETRKAWDGIKSYHASSGVDGWGQENQSRSPENSRSQSYRYRRSRSRSRSIGRGRGSSRSPSRGRGRSRSRGRGRGRSRSRSRSPVGDYQQESYRWSDRSGSGVPSQPCRDFTAGKCRRGGQCRFLHEDNLNQRDRGPSQEDRPERLRSMQEREGNYYDGDKDELQRTSYKSTALCNDFLKGRCQRGSSCRYSHHDASGDNSERSYRNSSSDQDYKRQPRKNGNPPCKFFMMGKCNRDNCRFSHDGPPRVYLEGKSENDRWGNDYSDMTRANWNGPKWGEATAVPESTDWGNAVSESVSHPTTGEKQTDDKWGSMEDKNKEWDDRNSNVEKLYLTDGANAEKVADDKCGHSLDNESKMWESQPPYGISENVNEQNIMAEVLGPQLGTTVMPSVLPQDLQIPQHCPKMGDGNTITDDLNSVNEVDVYANARHPSFVRCQNFNNNADNFGSQTPPVGGIHQSQHMIPINSSNGHDIDLNGPAQQNNSPSNLQNRTQIRQGESMMVNPATPQNVVNGEQDAQVTNFPQSVMQIFGNGQLPQLYAALNPSNPTESVPSLPNSSALFPPITSMDTQPYSAIMSPKQYDPIGDSIELNKPGNGNQPPGVLSDLGEQKNQMLLEHSLPLSAVAFDSGKEENGRPEDNNHRSLELSQHKLVANLVLDEKIKSISEKSKQEEKNIGAGNVDGDTKIVDMIIGKDEKAMRLFKVALVEYVKEILKPKWKEGQMSREVHKAIVKKVVDKVTSTIQAANIPKTQEKTDQYLSYSKPKLTKLVEAYTDRLSKNT